MADPMSQAFGTKPSSLPDPVPQNAAVVAPEEDLSAAFADLEFPSENMADQQVGNKQQAGQTQEEFFGRLGKQVENQQEPFDPEGELTDPISRAEFSFATTDREAVNYLSTKFGDNNARVTARGIEWRRGEQDPWKLVDNESFSLINDLFADNARTILEGTIEAGFTAGGFAGGAGQGAVVGAGAGAAAGSVVPGAGTVLGGAAGAVTNGLLSGVAGATTGAALGGAAAVSFVDKVQEEFIGIERDPERSSRTQEAVVAAGLGAGFGFLAGKFGSKFAAAKNKALALGETIESVKTRVRDINEKVELLNRLGVTKDGGELRLLPNQMAGDMVPELDAIAKALSTEDGYRNFIRQQGEHINEAFTGIAEVVGNIKGLNDPDFASKISNNVFSTKTQEGRVIGEFRDKALKQSIGAKYNTPRTGEALSQVAEGFGLSLGDPKLSQLTPTQVLSEYPDLTRDQAQAFSGIVKEFNDLANSKAQFSLKEIDGQYTKLRNKLDLLFKSNSGLPLAGKILPLKNSLRDDWAEIIGKELGEESQEAYLQSMARFSEVSDAVSELSTTVMKSEVSQEAFVRNVFSRGAQALPQLKALRTLVQEREPELWRDMVGNYMNQVQDEATDTVTGAVKWSQVRKKIDGLGKQMKNEIFAGTDYKPEVLDAMLEVGEFIEKSRTPFQIAGKANSLPGRLVRAGIVLFSNTLATQKADTAANLINKLGGQDNLLAEYLNAGGIEQMAKFIPKIRRADWATRMRVATDSAINNTVVVGKEKTTSLGINTARPLVREELTRDKTTRARLPRGN